MMFKWIIHILLAIATGYGVALTRPARAAVETVQPDLRQEFPTSIKKTIRGLQPPCLAGTIQILGGWVIRDQAGKVVAIGVLRRRC